MKENSLKERLELWIYLYKEDVFKLIKLFVPILVLFFGFMKLPTLPIRYKLHKLDTKTEAIVDVVVKNKGIVESEEGGKVVTKTYDVCYHYFVEGVKIQGTDIIERLSINIKQRALINLLETGDTIPIRYDSSVPKRSKIDVYMVDVR